MTSGFGMYWWAINKDGGDCAGQQLNQDADRDALWNSNYLSYLYHSTPEKFSPGIGYKASGGLHGWYFRSSVALSWLRSWNHPRWWVYNNVLVKHCITTTRENRWLAKSKAGTKVRHLCLMRPSTMDFKLQYHFRALSMNLFCLKMWPYLWRTEQTDEAVEFHYEDRYKTLFLHLNEDKETLTQSLLWRGRQWFPSGK